MQRPLLRPGRGSFLFVLIASVGFGCGSGGAADNGASAGITELKSSVTRMTPDVTEATGASNDEQAFAWNFFEQLDGTTNDVFSPYSISLATAMLSGAAAGDTLAQIQQAMHHSTSGSAFHAAQAALELALEALNKPANGAANDDVILRSSDDLWIQRGTSPTSEYLDTLGLYYGAGLHQFDDTNAALSAINAKVSNDTNELIPMLLAQLDPDTRFVLTNVLYFKGSWGNPWQDQMGITFQRLDGSPSSATLMSPPDTLFLGYGKADGYQVVSVPYANTSIELFVILPDAGKFEDLRAQIDDAFVKSAVASEESQEVELTFPKFDLDDDMGTALEDHLEALGMTDLFTAPELPGFGGAGPVTAVHHAHIVIDEKGTQAAAATAYGIPASAALNPVAFTVDRPFYFAIRDGQTSALLFIGQIVDPG